MKKLISFIICFLLCSVCFGAGITDRPVITSGTVAAGGVLISAVDGTAFIDVDTSKTGAADFSTAMLAAVANNDVVELTSKTNGRKIYGYAKAAGTGETLGDELITNGDFATGDPPSNWDATRSTAASETGAGNYQVTPSCKVTVTGGQANGNINQTVTLAAGKLVKYSVYLKNGNATSLQYKLQSTTTSTNYANAESLTPAAMTQYTSYGTQPVGNSAVWVYPILVIGDGKYGYTDEVSLKQVLTPSTSGATIVTAKGGSTYNFALKDSAFTYNDSAGYNYRILSSTAYGKLIATQSPVSGTLHIATKDGEAMFFHDSIDFSAYAGTDAGSTPYQFVFYDNTGKSAQAYAGAVGGGLTLGADLIAGWDFTSGWATGGTGVIDDANTFHSVDIGGVIKASIFTDKALYQVVGDTSQATMQWFQGTSSAGVLFGVGDGTFYGTANVSLSALSFYLRNQAAMSTDIASMTIKQLTDVPATGLHLMSAKNGTTRNMKSVESGFNPNTITRVNIYRAY